MTAQTRYGRATVEAAHALDREIPDDSLVSVLAIIVLGCVGIVVVGGIALYLAHLGVNVLDWLGGPR